MSHAANRRGRGVLLALAVILGMSLSMVSLTRAQEEEVPAPANAEELQGLSGDILVDGSSTVYPITAAAAEEFQQYAPDVRVTVGISGTGGGFDRFCRGETDISDASRPIDPDEVQTCAENGIEFIEVPVAYDGLSVMVNPSNDWVDCLTVAELNLIWKPESEDVINNWNQVRADFPDRPLKDHLYGADTDSGTFDYFTLAINGEEGASRGDYNASADDNTLVQGIAGDENALGYFGFAYYVANPDKLKLVAVDNGDGNCVLPSSETINNATYQPLSRPIFIYVKVESAARPEVAAFVNFYLSTSFYPLIDTPEVGYVPLAENYYDAIAARFNNGTTGTLWPNGAEVGATLDRYLESEMATPGASPTS